MKSYTCTIYCCEKQQEERLRQCFEMTQDEHESERNDPGRNYKRTVGEMGVNEKIDETARISRCRNRANKIYRHQNV